MFRFCLSGRMTQTRLESTAVISPLLTVTFYSLPSSRPSRLGGNRHCSKVGWHGGWGGRGCEKFHTAARAGWPGLRVYFRLVQRRRIKGVLEEVLTVPVRLRIGRRAAEEGELEASKPWCVSLGNLSGALRWFFRRFIASRGVDVLR